MGIYLLFFPFFNFLKEGASTTLSVWLSSVRLSVFYLSQVPTSIAADQVRGAFYPWQLLAEPSRLPNVSLSRVYPTSVPCRASSKSSLTPLNGSSRKACANSLAQSPPSKISPART